MSQQTIPVVDLRTFTHGDAAGRAAFAEQVGRALEETGFFALTHHGVDPALIRATYQTAQQFFGLPESVKQQYENPDLQGQRGFTSFGKEHARDHAAPDLKEFWHVGREGYPTYRPNLWPAEVPAFRPTLLALFEQLDRCAAYLLEACALYLDEPADTFRGMARDGNSILRIIHYPPVPEDAAPASLRAAPHEDINLITLLCEATHGGLELLQRDGTWLPIHALEGQIIVDSGDMLQWVTNGLFKSTTHRVVNPDNSREARYSMPFFVHPRPEVDLTPLVSCVARTAGRPVFPPITAQGYLSQRLQEIGLGRP
ncbi:MAG: isopenicillin N synthase family oxygenase [Gloeomargaritaceae cyanobacterium C42_A2020_066]|nr:isopenicillin N synthase family oxygenase [Gloeomargaritaceae cyanobacterium C42_A2020_066]